MAGGSVAILAALGSILAVAFVASALFKRTHVPDVLWLLLLGAVLGPVTGILPVATIESVLPLVAALAVVIILFDGALEVTPQLLRSMGARSTILSVGVFGVTTLACGAVAYLLLDLAWPLALLLGMAFGGAGIAIIVPLAKRMGVSGGGMTVILLEAVTSDILVILGVFLASTLLVTGAAAGALWEPVVTTLATGIVISLAAGWVWSRMLRRVHENAYMMTLAMLVLVYAATEALHGAGALAVLLFGVVVGNAKRPGVARRSAQPVLGTHLVAFHHEVTFFVRAFFFVSLGVVIDWTLLADPRFLLAGTALALTVAAVRIGIVHVVLAGSRLPRWDRVATGILFPMGLVTAAVSVVPSRQFGIAGTEMFPDVAAVVILLTNIFATLVVFIASWRHNRTAPGPPPPGGPGPAAAPAGDPPPRTSSATGGPSETPPPRARAPGGTPPAKRVPGPPRSPGPQG